MIWLHQRQPVWYVTVINTWGTSPRPLGSLFAFNPVTNEVSGSLSGGCVEQDLIAELNQCGSAIRPFKKLYGVDEQERSRYLLPCGGRLELLVEYLSPESDHLEQFSGINACLMQRLSISRSLDLDTGRSSLSTGDLTPKNGIRCCVAESNFTHWFGPAYRLLILGMGDITEHLASLAVTAGFSVTVCDPREDYLKRYGSSDVFSGQLVEVQHCLPDDLIRERFADSWCAVVALAHDPRVDDLALMAALDSQAYFVGALGSQLTCRKRLARLESLGVDATVLARLTAPVGLFINSKTPVEIAISIVAQLIEQRYAHQN